VGLLDDEISRQARERAVQADDSAFTAKYGGNFWVPVSEVHPDHRAVLEEFFGRLGPLDGQPIFRIDHGVRGVRYYLPRVAPTFWDYGGTNRQWLQDKTRVADYNKMLRREGTEGRLLGVVVDRPFEQSNVVVYFARDAEGWGPVTGQRWYGQSWSSFYTDSEWLPALTRALAGALGPEAHQFRFTVS
jgi:hypothetical protein